MEKSMTSIESALLSVIKANYIHSMSLDDDLNENYEHFKDSVENLINELVYQMDMGKEILNMVVKRI